MRQLSLMTDREIKQLCRKLLDERTQLVKALKKIIPSAKVGRLGRTAKPLSLFAAIQKEAQDALEAAGEEV